MKLTKNQTHALSVAARSKAGLVRTVAGWVDPADGFDYQSFQTINSLIGKRLLKLAVSGVVVHITPRGRRALAEAS